MLCIGYAEGQSGGGKPRRKPCLWHPHPGLRYRTMLRIASARPTLPARGRDRTSVTLRIAKTTKARFDFVTCDCLAARGER